MLQPGERRPFSSADDATLSLINVERGKDEIPLVLPGEKRVLYGIDALLEILGARFPLVRKAGHSVILYPTLRKLYKLISYNRKVIVARKCGPGDIDCSPAFNPTYRVLFLLVTLLINTLMLLPVHNQILIHLPFYHRNMAELQGAHAFLVVANLVCAATLPLEKALSYLGQVSMLAVSAVLLLVPLIILSNLLMLPVIAVAGYLVIVIAVIFREYTRRMAFAGTLLSRPWVTAANLTGIAFFMVYLFNTPI